MTRAPVVHGRCRVDDRKRSLHCWDATGTGYCRKHCHENLHLNPLPATGPTGGELWAELATPIGSTFMGAGRWHKALRLTPGQAGEASAVFTRCGLTGPVWAASEGPAAPGPPCETCVNYGVGDELARLRRARESAEAETWVNTPAPDPGVRKGQEARPVSPSLEEQPMPHPKTKVKLKRGVDIRATAQRLQRMHAAKARARLTAEAKTKDTRAQEGGPAPAGKPRPGRKLETRGDAGRARNALLNRLQAPGDTVRLSELSSAMAEGNHWPKRRAHLAMTHAAQHLRTKGLLVNGKERGTWTATESWGKAAEVLAA